jgi:hypothetical protein
MTLSAAGADRWNYVLSVTSPVASVRQATVFEDRGGDWRPALRHRYHPDADEEVAEERDL